MIELNNNTNRCRYISVNIPIGKENINLTQEILATNNPWSKRFPPKCWHNDHKTGNNKPLHDELINVT